MLTKTDCNVHLQRSISVQVASLGGGLPSLSRLADGGQLASVFPIIQTGQLSVSDVYDLAVVVFCKSTA